LRGERRLRLLENMVPRICGPKKDKVKGKGRKLHNEELNDLYSSPNIVRVIKPRRMSWTGHVARMEERRDAYRVLVRKPEGKRPLGRPRLDGMIILKWIFRKRVVVAWTGSSWIRIGTGGGHL